MSLAAVPAFLIARRVVRPSLALLAALIAVAVPSMAYTATLTTESLFYPIALTFVWLLLRYLDGTGLGTTRRAHGWRSSSRSQRARSRWRSSRRSPRHRFSSRSSSGDGAPSDRSSRSTRSWPAPRFSSSVVQAARGLGPTDLLGAYSIVGDGGYDAGSVAHMLLWHLQELDPLRGHRADRCADHPAVARTWPCAADPAASRCDRVAPRLEHACRRHVRLAVRVRSHPGSLPLLPRAAARDRAARLGRGRSATAASRDGCSRSSSPSGLPLLFPFSRFISEPAKSDTLGLLPLWTINEHLVLGRVLDDSRPCRARSRAGLPARACEGGGRSAARCARSSSSSSRGLSGRGLTGSSRAEPERSSRGSGASTGTGSIVPCPMGRRSSCCGRDGRIGSR